MFGLFVIAPFLWWNYKCWFSTFLSINSVVKFRLIGSSLVSVARAKACSICRFCVFRFSNNLTTKINLLLWSVVCSGRPLPPFAAGSTLPILILIATRTFSMRSRIALSKAKLALFKPSAYFWLYVKVCEWSEICGGEFRFYSPNIIFKLLAPISTFFWPYLTKNSALSSFFKNYWIQFCNFCITFS